MVRGPIDIKKHRQWLRSSLIYKEAERLSSQLEPFVRGQTGGVFVNTHYPNVEASSVAIKRVVKPEEMLSWNYKDIILYALENIHGRVQVHVSQPVFQELAMSYKPIEYEMELEKRPKPLLEFSPYHTPVGPGAPLRKLWELENPKIPRKVDSLYNERIKAEIALRELMHYDHYYLINLLSAGVLGSKKRMVPTRWAITATDDTLSKFYISRLRDFPEVNEILMFQHSFLYNHFHIILFPGRWEFENFEAWAPNTSWGAQHGYLITREYEDLRGRKNYAESQAGGYYASKYAVSKSLYVMGRQARVVVIREVEEGYRIPVGVWQVRESVKKAFTKKPLRFDDREQLLTYLSHHLKLPLKEYLSRSTILRQRKTLLDF
ncbi:MAG: hypothetical protein GXN92_01590 [Candidatus Micrarchaeota archaeon]|nr:hypothetical protein [Candidatus Micrarchaeota archaeon]